MLNYKVTIEDLQVILFLLNFVQTLVWYTVLKLSQTPNPELIKIDENSDSGPIQREKIGKQY